MKSMGAIACAEPSLLVNQGKNFSTPRQDDGWPVQDPAILTPPDAYLAGMQVHVSPTNSLPTRHIPFVLPSGLVFPCIPDRDCHSPMSTADRQGWSIS